MINIYNNDNLRDIHWHQWILIGVGAFVAIILLFIPLVVVFTSACAEGFQVIKINLMNRDMLHAIFLTLIVTLLTVPINVIFGTFMAWLITHFEFYGKKLLFTILNIPIAVSPVIAGLLYLLLYANDGIIGVWLNKYNIQIVFTWVGIVLVTIFVTCPFVVHELVPVMVNQGSQEYEAAILLGASGWMLFCYVIFPNIRWALLYGAIVTNARAIGEFGAVSIISGLVRGETYTLSLYVELLYQDYNIVGAFIAASLLAFISIIMLFIKYYLQRQLHYMS